MKNSIAGHVPGIPIIMTPKRLLFSETNSKQRADKEDFTIDRTNTIMKRSNSFALKIIEHAKLGPRITEAVKGKLSLGAKILQTGGVTKVFKQNFSTRKGEKLLKFFQCYVSTTAGPIAGLLFISSDKVAFCSKRSIKISSEMGELVKIRYKVVIPLTRIQRANDSINFYNPSKKYVEIVTVDDFDFWFMGFLNHHKTIKYLQQAISEARK